MPIDLTTKFKDDPSPPAGIDMTKPYVGPPEVPSGPSLISRARSTVAEGLAPAWQGWAAGVNDSLEDFRNDFKPGKESTPLHGLKTFLMDLPNIALSPPYRAVTGQVNATLDSIKGLLSKAASPDEAKKQGIDWKIHKKDIENTFDSLKSGTEALIGALPIGGARELSQLERAATKMRISTQEAHSILEPETEGLKTVTLSLDHSMGFQKVKDVVGQQLASLPEGSKTSAGMLIDSMIPHAEGYAKTFLQKLGQNIDRTVPVKFGSKAGEGNSYGVYYPGLHRIEIKTQVPDIIHTTVHEMVHAATINMMDTLLEGDMNAKAAQLGRALTPEEKLKIVHQPMSPVLKELDQAIQEARVRAGKAGRSFYGVNSFAPTNIENPVIGERAFDRSVKRYEFVAEVFSNPELQEFLANSERYASVGYKAKNMFTQLTNWIAGHLGIKSAQELRLLDHSMRVGEQIMKLSNETRPRTGRDIWQIVVAHGPEGAITEGDIAASTREVGHLKPGKVNKVKSTLALSIEGVLRALAPEAIGQRAKLAASVVASRISEQMQRTTSWKNGSKTRSNYWRGRPDMVNTFLERFEKGQPMVDKAQQDVADAYRRWNDQILAQDQKISRLEYEPRENYLYHVFEDSEGVANYFSRKYGGKWGDPRFIKDRTFDLYKEAVAAGFTPKFDNPEDIMLARQHASDIAAMHTGILDDLERFGLALKKVKGGQQLIKTVDPQGKVSLSVKTTQGTKQPAGSTRWRAPNGEIFWIDNQAKVILDNAFNSKSLWADKTLLGSTFRGLMAMKNSIVPIRLALSLFHPLHVVGIDIAAGWTREASGLLSGSSNPVKALGGFLRSGFGPLFENPKSGWRVLSAWRGKIDAAKLTAADTEALKTMMEGGLIPDMSAQYRTNAKENFMNALRDSIADMRRMKPGSLAVDTAKATWHLPWAMLSAIQAPIFEHWIPALKTASYLKDAKALLARNPQLLSNDPARYMALRKLAKSVENRYGEMAYNTLFWKRWTKDLAVLNTLSLGWQLGFIREYGGGALDLGQFMAKGNKLERIRQGQLDRPIFVAAYTALGAATAGLMTWAMSGEYPQEPLDWTHPKTGEKNPDGSDQRVATMFYSREFAGLYKHIQNQGVVPGLSEMVLNKGSGLFGLMHEWTTGVNSFGQDIRDPDSDAFTKVEQTLAYTLSDLEPISMRSLQDQLQPAPVGDQLQAAGQLAKSAVTTKPGILSVLGFTPAPKYLTESQTEARIKDGFRRFVAPQETPFEKAEYSKEYSALRKAYQEGSERYPELMDKMSEQFQLSAQDQRRMMRSLNSPLSASMRMFMRLPWQEQKKVLDKATQEERDELLPHSNKQHVRNSYEAPQ